MTAPKDLRASLHTLADWIADQLEQPESTSRRVAKVIATDEEREFARDEMRSMTTPKRKRRTG